MKTDGELTARVQAAATELAVAIDAAREAGLRVDVHVLETEMIGPREDMRRTDFPIRTYRRVVPLR